MSRSLWRRGSLAWLALAACCALAARSAAAHPLGNFSINQFARIEPAADRVRVHYVADLAEIPAYQELLRIDADGDGRATPAELDAYVAREATAYADDLTLEIDGRPARLAIGARSASLAPGAGGLSTLRIELDLEAPLGAGAGPHALRFENRHLRGHAGWSEISVRPAAGVQVFDSSAYAGSASDELRAYPQGRLTAPLDERTAELSFAPGAPPAGARAAATRGVQPARPPEGRDALAALIAQRELGPLAIALALVVAFLLGATHALSPGHGKTIAAAYLVGARAHWRHAVYLALTVTLTHTAAVYALGFATLGASRHVTPAQLLPVLSLLSGAIVLCVGLALLARRLRAALAEHAHAHAHAHHHPHHHDHHHHDGAHGHAHFPAGSDGARPGWRGWLAFGISGGLIPCPSALVVMLSAIALERIAYGLVLVTVFSLGLAATLSAVGVLFVHAGRGLQARRIPAWTRLAPVASALVITGVGVALCWEALDGVKSLTGPFWLGG